MSTPSSCPFCNIASTYPPISPTTFTPENNCPNPPNTKKPYTSAISLPDSSDPTQPTAHLILSTKYVLAFLDIMPLTRGHVLVIPRTHYEKLGDVDIKVSRELGQWLPILSRVVMRTIFSEDDSSDWNWNVVQNNGIRAAQQVPHAHFHIIPRPSSNPAANAARASFVMFGRGQREELDDDEGEELAGLLRGELARDILRVREMGVDLEGEVYGDDSRRVKGKL
ncbi:HIT-like domain-containing protein [Aspergillus novoparasiticus]|uniref:HIT-like domain-containing protein n=1 Tax=Aspergillus novoparasiticus TaxID=986946 RepID=A0A5N6EMD6_9EURO|nr:HIT-like domain-containing protein [Aspergillus novoparasiticus]